MPNALEAYNEIWYANKAIERLEKLLTFLPTLTRDYDDQARTKGELIQIKRPGEFEAKDLVKGDRQDVRPTKIQMKLDQHKGVQFEVSDLELAYNGDEIIDHHIDPAMHAVADAMEQSTTGLYRSVPLVLDHDAGEPFNDFADAKTLLDENKVAGTQRYAALHFRTENAYVKNTLFNQANTSSQGSETQREGFLGRKAGFDTYSNANLPAHTAGTLSVTALALVGAHAKGAVVVTMDANAVVGTLKAGDTFVIAGNAQRYAVTSDAAAAGNAISVGVFPPLAQAYADNAAVTVKLQSKSVSLFYHKTAFTMAMAPLSDKGTMSAAIGVALDPQTGVAIRVTRWYDADGPGAHMMKFDALWGFTMTDAQRALRLER